MDGHPSSPPQAQSGASLSRASRILIYSLFFLTGGSALAYETVWTRWLELLLGSSAYAVTAVLAAFMGGLAVGGALFGRWADRTERRLSLYGWLEITVGLYGLAFPTLLAAATGVYVWLARALAIGPLTTFSLRFGIAFLLVAIPTTLMGGTLPLLVRHLAGQRGGTGRGVAWLYCLNSAGAATGCLLAGFVTIGRFGLQATSILAVIINIGAGLTALMLRRRNESTGPVLSEPSAPAGIPNAAYWPSPRQLAWAALLSGAAAMAYEVGWFRILALVLGSSADAFTLMLATFIGGLAAGSLWASSRIDRWDDPARRLAWVQAAIGLVAVGTLPLVQFLPMASMRLRAMALGSYPIYQGGQLLLCALLMAGPTLLLGISFPLLARLAAGAGPSRGARGLGKQIGGIVAWTTAGNIAGTLGAGLVLIPLVGTRWTLTLAAAGSAAAGLLVNVGEPRRRLVWGVTVAAAAAAIALVSPAWNPSVLTGAPFRVHDVTPDSAERFAAVNRQRDVLFLREDSGATVSVEQRDDNRVLRVNGKPDASLAIDDMLTQRLTGHYPMLFHPDPRDVMVIGLGSGVTVGAVLRYPVASVTVAEISPGVVEASRLFADVNHRFWEDPRVRVRTDDARHVLLIEDATYDVIVSEPSNLWMTGVATLYTEEFYQLVRRRLRPGGMLVQWLHTYEMETEDLRMVLRTLLSAFPQVTVFRSNSGDLEFLASDRLFEWDFDRIRARFEQDSVRADLAPLGLTDLYTLLTNQEIAPEDVPAYAGTGALHVDDWPLLERNTPRAFFKNARVDLPAAQLRLDSPHTVVKRYLAGRPPTPAEELAFASFTIKAGGANNLALTALERTLRAQPENREALRLLADALGRRGSHVEAVALGERAAALEPPAAEDFRRLALLKLEVARRRIGFFAAFDPQEGLDAMQRSIELAPARADYRREYGAMLLEAGHREEGERQLALAAAAAPLRPLGGVDRAGGR